MDEQGRETVVERAGGNREWDSAGEVAWDMGAGGGPGGNGGWDNAGASEGAWDSGTAGGGKVAVERRTQDSGGVGGNAGQAEQDAGWGSGGEQAQQDSGWGTNNRDAWNTTPGNDNW